MDQQRRLTLDHAAKPRLPYGSPGDQVLEEYKKRERHDTLGEGDVLA
jgi:hypothetical protein